MIYPVLIISYLLGSVPFGYILTKVIKRWISAVTAAETSVPPTCCAYWAGGALPVFY